MKNINCQKCQKLLSLYIDSALVPEEVSRIETHLENCIQCAEELRLMNRTVHLLHNMPQEKAPASLVHDIHRKLEKKSRLDTVRDWFITFPLKKTSYGAVALVFVGVATAALIRNIPHPGSDSVQLAENRQGVKQKVVNSSGPEKDESTVLAKNDKDSEAEYYPDIPSLSEYKPGEGNQPGQSRTAYSYYTRPELPDKQNEPKEVDMVTTGNSYQKNRNNSFFSADSPDIMDNNSITNSKRVPDLRITFSPKNEKEKNKQIYQLIHSSDWHTQKHMNNNTLYLMVPAENMDKLVALCSQYKGRSLQSLVNKGKQRDKNHLVSIHWR
ncbi:MAG: anti-sigma factor family protein [Desulfurivibrionaceae bacterium]